MRKKMGFSWRLTATFAKMLLLFSFKNVAPWKAHTALTSLFLLAPTFSTNPPDPLSVLEGNNITFVWQYNPGGTLSEVIFRFIGSTATMTIVDKFDINRDAVVPRRIYQGRVQENINATRAEITIFALQRSESGEYEIELNMGK